MTAEFDLYDYIISIDIGTTFSGSCFSYIEDRKSIIHVVKWPEQLENDTFEKTPTACLYSKNSGQLLKWGKSALDHMITYPNDDNVTLVDQFKLKLYDIFQQERNSVKSTLQESQALYRTAAIDYLREIQKYTCTQLIRTVSPDSCSENRIRYVLTIPATWVDQDSSAMRSIAVKAGLIDAHDPKERLIIINEAHAAALFCEREYCVTEDGRTSKLIKGQRYLLCDAGGGTIDLATYECTGSDNKSENNIVKNEHCQLALESGGACGSTILDQNMEKYLREQVFFWCIEDNVLKSLVDQFIKEIKHYFGGDDNRNNYLKPSTDKIQSTEISAATLTTTETTKMVDVHENDYDYEEDYQDYNSEISLDQEEDEEYMFDDEDSYDDNMSIDNNIQEEVLLPTDYVYFTLPNSGKGIDQSILENLSLKGSIISTSDHQQLRISHADISKYVFDPVIENVVSLIAKQIKKSHTKIDTLFLLGGFGQSPYLYKKLHQEFITSTNSVTHLIVPEDGYRASMRGGIYFGIDCIDMIPRHHTKNMHSVNRKIHRNSKFRTLVGIDLNFFDLTATYTYIELKYGLFNHSSKIELRNSISLKDLEVEHGAFQIFAFDNLRFFDEYFSYLAGTLHDCLTDITQCDAGINTKPDGGFIFDDTLYYEYLVKAFIHQLYEAIEDKCRDLYGNFSWDNSRVRYCISIASSSKKNTTDANLPDSSMDILKRLLLSKLLSINSVFSAKEAITVHKYVVNLMNNKALSKNSADRIMLYKKILQAATEVGMIEDYNDKDRMLWNGNTFKSFLAYRYFFHPINNAIINKGLNKEVFTFDLHGSEKTSKVITCTDRENITCKYKEYSILLDNIESRLYEWDFNYFDPKMVDNGIKSGQYTLKKLMKFLSKGTNCMSPHLCTYIKNHVDLSNPKETHKLGDLFFITGTDKIVNITSATNAKGIYHAIRYFRDSVLSTKLILSSLIEPWIKHQLTPAIVDVCRRHQSRNMSDWGSKECCLLFTGEIIETKYNGLLECKLPPTPPGDRTWPDYYIGTDNYTWADYLFQVLQASLENHFKGKFNDTIPYRILYDNRPDYSRHIDCLMKGVIHHDRYNMERISSKRYALHLLALDLKPTIGQPSFCYKVGNINDDFSDNEEPKLGMIKAKVVNALENNGLTFLHPLVNINEILADAKNTCLKFQVPRECSIAAVLYASEDTEPQDHNISNNSFKKIHRFIFPVKDATKPITISYSAEEYFLLFTVKQDDYEADYRCIDF